MTPLTARLISAVNAAEAVIVARFNQAVLQDAALRSPANWTLLPASDGALPAPVMEVVVAAAYPEMVLLRYAEGGGDYTLVASSAHAPDGAALDPAFASVPVAITRPGEGQMMVRLFDSVWGPLGIAQRATRRRTVDQLVANRALALGVNQQLAQRLGRNPGAAGRDGRAGLGRV